MKKIILINYLFFIIIVASSGETFEGKWIFQNQFFQVIQVGGVSFEISPVGLVLSLNIDNKEKINPNDHSFPGEITLTAFNDIVKTYSAKIIESTPDHVFIFYIKELDDLSITFFVEFMDEKSGWYSYSIGMNADKSKFVSSLGQENFMNFIGTMHRVE